MTNDTFFENKALQKFQDEVEEVQVDKIDSAYRAGMRKLEKLGINPPAALVALWQDIKLMLGLLTDYAKGNYTEVPWKVVAAITGAIVYFVSPLDAIPDFIPLGSYVDDALVIKLAMNLASEDLAQYARWRQAKANKGG